jgi:transposase
MSPAIPSRKDLPVDPDGRHGVGIDVGLQSHAAAGVTKQGRRFGRILRFANDRAGIDRLDAALLRPLGGPKAVLVGMEATGHYWMPLYYDLLRRGYSCVVLNPLQTSAKFRARIRKAKTDPLDAHSIARLLLSGEARASRVPDDETFALRLKTRHRWKLAFLAADLQRFAHSLVDRLFPEFHHVFDSPLNATGRALLREIGLDPRALADRPDDVADLARRAGRKKVCPAHVEDLLAKARASIGVGRAQDVLVAQLRGTVKLIELLEEQREALDDELDKWVEQRRSPLRSLGIRAPLVATIHAESDPISDFRHSSQYAAYAGLDPSVHDSGNLHGTRTPISKRGSPYLRHALYQSAAALYRYRPCLRRLYQKNRKAGRHHVDALVIVAHKLARIVWRLLTDGRDFRALPPKPSNK